MNTVVRQFDISHGLNLIFANTAYRARAGSRMYLIGR
jgi:hypothetical protein